MRQRPLSWFSKCRSIHFAAVSTVTIGTLSFAYYYSNFTKGILSFDIMTRLSVNIEVNIEVNILNSEVNICPQTPITNAIKTIKEITYIKYHLQ